MLPVVWSEHDGSDAVAKFWHLYERRARRFLNTKGAEFDDLVQEAAIAGWRALQDGYVPTALIIDRRCMRYIRSLDTGGSRLVNETSW